MGNGGSTGSGSGGGNSRRRNSHHQQPPPPPLGPPAQQQPEVGANRYVFAAATPYPPQYPNPNTPQYYQYGYYPPPPPAMPVPLPTPFDHHHHGWVDRGRYPYPPSPTVTAPYFEHQEAVTIRNDINLKKETLSVEPDEQNPGRFLVAFTFDATVSGSITVYFFAKEGFDCNLTSTMENLLKPVTVLFQEGLGQKFRQPSGTGIDFSMFEEPELVKEGETEVYPLAVKAESSPSINQGPVRENQKIGTPDSQITQAVFEKKENGEYRVRVVKQILWVNGTRYELQEIYGIGNSVEGDFDGNDPGKECVICLSEPRDMTVLPCRHMLHHGFLRYLWEKPDAFFCNAGDPGARMLGIGCLSKPYLLGCKCMCSECAKVLRFQTNRCPICRQPVERLLEIKVNKGAEEQHESQ